MLAMQSDSQTAVCHEHAPLHTHVQQDSAGLKHTIASTSLILPNLIVPCPIRRHPDVVCHICRLHVASMGRAAGKPLMLMLHGFPESWISWRHQLEAFCSDYHVAAVDLRGYGQSSKPKVVLMHQQMDV